MASNRATTATRSASKPASAETSRDALAALARHTARIQIAALTATGTAIADWAQAADRLVQTVGDELLRRVDRETDSGELIVRVASATNVHLRELTTLPRTATEHFNTRLSCASIDK